MAIIQLILALVVVGIIYRRMIRREKPSPISGSQALVPVVFGLISLPASFLLVLGIGQALLALGFSSSGASPLIRSFFWALFMAGIPEELAKLGFILLTIRIFRSKIKNVYEYILIGVAVGFGFTLLEEFSYGSSNGILAGTRLLTITAHVIFGIIMARHLGLARYKRVTGSGGAAKETIFAILIPILIHTLFDACTGNSLLLQSENEDMQLAGLILALIATIILFVMQFAVLLRLKKNAEKYCDMTLLNSACDPGATTN